MAARKVNLKKTNRTQRGRARVAGEAALQAAELDGNYPARMQLGGAAVVPERVSELWIPENRDEVLRLVAHGNKPQVAFPAAGIPAAVWGRWLERAKRGEAEFVVFFEAVATAHAKALVRWGGMMELAARGQKVKAEVVENGQKRTIETDPDVKALTFLLERAAPEHWGKTIKNEHTGKGGGPIVTQGYVPPFKFDRDFERWSKAELKAYVETGAVPERFQREEDRKPTSLAPAADLDAYLAGL